MPTQFVLALYLFAVPSDMAMFIRKNNSTNVLWLLNSQISWNYFGITPLSVAYTFWTSQFFTTKWFVGWGKTNMASEMFLGLILISPLWVA